MIAERSGELFAAAGSQRISPSVNLHLSLTPYNTPETATRQDTPK
jgi:hypothetical protein